MQRSHTDIHFPPLLTSYEETSAAVKRLGPYVHICQILVFPFLTILILNSNFGTSIFLEVWKNFLGTFELATNNRSGILLNTWLIGVSCWLISSLSLNDTFLKILFFILTFRMQLRFWVFQSSLLKGNPVRNHISLRSLLVISCMSDLE